MLLMDEHAYFAKNCLRTVGTKTAVPAHIAAPSAAAIFCVRKVAAWTRPCEFTVDIQASRGNANAE